MGRDAGDRDRGRVCRNTARGTGAGGAGRTIKRHQAMSASRAITSSDPVQTWDELLRPALEHSPEFPKEFLKKLRVAKMTFGKRVHCPFLRPFFLSTADEQRVRRATEMLARIAEKVTSA